MDKIGSDKLSAYVVWVPRLGGTPDHVPEASTLLVEPRARHYWDDNEALGMAYKEILSLEIDTPAWDTYFLYDAGVAWGEDSIPSPRYWAHQLTGVTSGPQLDGELFREQVSQALLRAGATGS